MTHQELITFSASTVNALNGAVTDRFTAVATAAREAVDHDRAVTVRTFADSLRAVTVGLGMAQAVLAASLKAAKEGSDVEQAMADAARTAADKAREARARASKTAEKKSAVKAFMGVEDTLFALGGREKSELLVQIEEQKGKVAALMADLKSAREHLADLETMYLTEQKTALKAS